MNRLQENKPDLNGAGKRQTSKAATRSALLAAARREIAKKGYHGISVREISSAAGVSTGAFYSNFENKRELFDTIVEEIYTAIKNIVDRTTGELIQTVKKTQSGRLTSKLVHRAINQIFCDAVNELDLLRILRREAMSGDPAFKKQFNHLWESLVQAIKRALDAYVAAGLSTPYDTDLVARATLPMLITMLLNAGARPERFDDIVTVVTALLDGGIMKLSSRNENKGSVQRDEGVSHKDIQ